MSKPTDIGQFIADLDGGVFDQKVSKMLSDVAAAVIDQNKVGQVVIKLDLKRFEDTFQVVVSHDLSYKMPTRYGTKSENDKKATPMHVGVGGHMSLFPESQVNQGQLHLSDKDDSNKLVEGQIGEKS